MAQALINDPDLLILDEPTGGLDPLGRMDIRRIIASRKSAGKTVFFSSHELSEVELACDRVAILSKGQLIAEGPVSELVPPGENLERYFIKAVTT
jgi:ABC-2 type transport system ATP-binding protein